MQIHVVKEILKANDHIAEVNRAQMVAAKVFSVNLMASPGAGKTSLILATAKALQGKLRLGVIEGDLASSIDAERVAEAGLPVVQINTGGNCHLDAPMLSNALRHLDMNNIDLLFVENVGNLVCPANFALGTDIAVVLASTPEGHDKPYKYPGMFAKASAVVLNKSDVSEVFDFDTDYFQRGLRMVNGDAPFFTVSCKTLAGVDAWAEWLYAKVRVERG